jgi:hypothetical protein
MIEDYFCIDFVKHPTVEGHIRTLNQPSSAMPTWQGQIFHLYLLLNWKRYLIA